MSSLEGTDDHHKVVEKLQTEKLALEKELKKKNDLIALTKDKQAVQQLIDENAKMKQEMEVLEMFKTQNVALKDHMHQIAASSDEQRVKLAHLIKENIELKSKLPQTDLGGSVAAPAAENPMDSIIKGFETTINDLRSENLRLEEALKKSQDELAEEKKKVADAIAKSATPQPATTAGTSATSAAAITSKLWWGSTASKPTTPTPSAQPAPSSASTTHLPVDTSKLEEQLKTANAEIDKLKSQISTLESNHKPSANATDSNAITAIVFEEAKKDHVKLVEGLQAEIQTLKTQLQQARETSAENHNLVSNIEKSLHEAKEALEKSKEEAKLTKQQLAQSETIVKNAKDLDTQLQTVTSQLKEISQTLEEAKAEVAKSNAKIAEESKNSATMAAKAAELEKSLASGQLQITTLSNSLKEQGERIQALTIEANAQKSSHEKSLQSLKSEKDSLVSTYEGKIRTLQETVAKKSIELQALQAKTANSEGSPEGESNATAAPGFDFLTSPEFESLKSGYENDKKISLDRIASLEIKISSQIAELEDCRKSMFEKEAEIDTLKRNSADQATQLSSQLRDKETEVEQLKAKCNALQDQIDQVSKKLSESSQVSAGLEGKLQEAKAVLNKEHADALKKREAEIDAAHNKETNALREEYKKEKSALEEKAKKEKASLEEKFKQEKASLEASSAQSVKELEQLRKELSDFKDNASKGSKTSEAQIKALEERHKKELNELAETSKRSLTDLEARLKKELTEAVKVAEEKKKKEVEDKMTKERHDVEEKLNKEKSASDEKHQKEKSESEERFKKEKSKIQSDLDSAKAEVDKLKKDVANQESQKAEQAKKFEKELFSRNDDIGKYTSKIKAIESEFESFKGDAAKSAAELNDKVSLANTAIGKLNEELVLEKSKYSQLQSELKLTQDKLNTIQTKMDVITAELEVSRSSSDRLSKMNGEKDDAIKKLKQRTDELTQTQTNLAKTIAGLEKDKENLSKNISSQTYKIGDLESRLQQQQNDFSETRKADAKNIDSLNEAIVALKTENFTMATKVKDVQSEHRAMEKRGALIIKDLQKQIIKERKRQGSPEQSQNDSMDSLATHSRQPSESQVRKPTKSHSHNENAAPGGVGIPKVERLTTELLQLAKENETLNKRSKNAEEEIRTLHDRLAKQTEELELKSKAVQQYMLREYSTQLQPDEAKKSGFSMDVLTNSSAMHKMNPVLLSQVNVKMQKLLEELTSKLMGLEEENRVLKRADQTAVNTVLKSSTV